MGENKLFLYSLLENDPVLLKESDLLQNIMATYEINKLEFDALLEESNQFVFREEIVNNDALESILSFLKRDVAKTYFYPKDVWSISNCIFPQKERPFVDSDLLANYKSCIQTLQDKQFGIKNFADNLFYLQQFFLSSIPPTVAALKTVSHFEWIKSRASFAQCLFKETDKKQPFILFCGDVSGIQNFIYNIHSSKAYKSLKGRSFYLQLLVDGIIDDLLKELKLPVSNIIYSNGGKFYLLLPNNIKNQNILTDFDKKIQQALWNRYHMELYVCLGWINFGIGTNYSIITEDKQLNGTRIEKLSDLWKAVSEKTAQRKARKFDAILLDQYAVFFGEERPKEDYNGKGMTICAVSGLPVKEIEENQMPFSDDEPIYVQKEIKAQIMLGEQLRKSQVIGFSPNPFSKSMQLMDFDYHVGLVSDLEESHVDAQYSLLNPDSKKSYMDFIKKYGSARFKFYGGHQSVLNDASKIANLEEIASVENTKDQSLNKIAVLKMDVDNLGQLFISMDVDYAVFAAMSDLAARIDWFFSGYINTIRNQEQFRDTVNIIYAGGDDLCVIGKWDRVLEFGTCVREAFRSYTGNDEAHTLSAGYVMCHPKFPITKAIDLAEKELERAKKYKLNATEDNFDKNAIALFGTAVYWQETDSENREWHLIKVLSDFFYTSLEQKKISKGLIYQLHAFNAIRLEGALDWYWKSAYYFAKMGIKYKDFKVELKQLSEAIITGKIDLVLPNNQGRITYKSTSNRLFELIIIAVKIADFRTR